MFGTCVPTKPFFVFLLLCELLCLAIYIKFVFSITGLILNIILKNSKVERVAFKRPVDTLSFVVIHP